MFPSRLVSVLGGGAGLPNDYSLAFDGTNDYVDITGVISSLSSATTGTIMAWVKPVSGTTEEYILNFGDANANELIGFKVMGDGNNNGDLLVQENIGGSGQWQVRTDSPAFSSGVWTHIVLTQDGTEPVIYIDGVAVAQTVTETTDKTVWFDDTSGLDDGRIGAKLANSGYDWFTGNICQVGIWDAVLDQEQIQSIMEKTYEELTASEKTDLVSYWALDETIESSGSGASFVYDKMDASLGSELITGSWSASGNWTESGGTISTTSETSTMLQNILTDAKVYKISYTANVTSGTFKVYAGGGSSGALIDSSGSYVEYLKCSSNTYFYFDGVTSFTGSISDISVKQVQGNAGVLT